MQKLEIERDSLVKNKNLAEDDAKAHKQALENFQFKYDEQFGAW